MYETSTGKIEVSDWKIGLRMFQMCVRMFHFKNAGFLFYYHNNRLVYSSLFEVIGLKVQLDYDIKKDIWFRMGIKKAPLKKEAFHKRLKKRRLFVCV